MTFERLEHSQIKASFSVTAEEFSEALDEAFKICNANVTIKGFRKGKASKEVYLKHYGVESLYADAVDAAVSRKMREELLPNEEVEIASQPQLDLDYKTVKEGSGFDFTLTFDTLPEVKLGLYKGVQVEALSNVPTDDEIQGEEDRLLKSKITTEEKADGVIAKGDTANFDFVGSVDGVEFEGGKAENFDLKIGSGQFIPGFEDQMIGMKANTEGDIKVTFPENYGEKSLAGKEANFHLTIHSVKAEVKPELTDELVKELKIEGVETVAAFKEHLVTSLTERKTNFNNRQMENACLERVVEASEIDLPRGLLAERTQALKNQAESQAKQYNIPFETFLQFSGVTLEAFNKQAEEEATRQVKTEFVLDEIARVENLTVTDEEIEASIKDYAQATKLSEKEVLKRIGKAPFAANLSANKALKFILDNKIVK